MKCICFKDKDEINEEVEEDETAEMEAEEKLKNIKENTEDTNNEEECELRRAKKSLKRYDDEYIFANYCCVDVPNTFDEAMSHEDADHWQQAMNKEIRSLEGNQTWKLVKKPDKEILDVKWVYTKKFNGTFKARLVVKGYQQKDEVENTYAPGCKR